MVQIGQIDEAQGSNPRARKIPPRIAEAVAGIELLGQEIVDRSDILNGIQQMAAVPLQKNLAQMLTQSSAIEGLLKSQKTLQQFAQGYGNSIANQILQNSSFVEATRKFIESGASAKALKEISQKAIFSQETVEKITGSALVAKQVSDTLNSQVILAFQKEATKMNQIVREMKQSGWLLDTGVHGKWEFAPASRAGAFSTFDPFIALRATFDKSGKEKNEIAVAMESAAFILQLSEHAPRRPCIASAKNLSRTGALKNYRHVQMNMPPSAITQIDGLQVHTMAALLSSMAIRPLAYRDWPNVSTWIAKACKRIIVNPDRNSGTLKGKGGLLAIIGEGSEAAIARVAYFFRYAGEYEVANEVLKLHDKEIKGPIYLGRREARKSTSTFDPVTRVYDNLLDKK
ncbi:MAG: hypothetical protein HY050_10845 [Actinobacteria bacterium]|nr:hypothetical protein [Actinomycetota bacterium]